MTNIAKPVKVYLFADDLTIVCTGKNIYTIKELLQNTLNNL